jgi:parallel beta-helix repeat protein
MPGTYSEKVSLSTSGSSGSPITFQADSSGDVIVTGGNQAFDLSNITWNVFDGFIITGTSYEGIYFRSGSNNNTVKNCVVKNCGSDGIRLTAADGITVENCLIYNNSSEGIITGNGSDSLSVENCTIYGNTKGIKNYSAGSVLDCIITNNSTYGVEAGSSQSVTYSDVWNNGTNYSGGVSAGSGCISSDPDFVDAANGDFHLDTGSPCIDAASDSGDMGYEY